MTELPRMPAPDDEIDLRAWLQALVRAWKLIVGTTVLALVIAGGYTLLQPGVYEATAILMSQMFLNLHNSAEFN